MPTQSAHRKADPPRRIPMTKRKNGRSNQCHSRRCRRDDHGGCSHPRSPIIRGADRAEDDVGAARRAGRRGSRQPRPPHGARRRARRQCRRRHEPPLGAAAARRRCAMARRAGERVRDAGQGASARANYLFALFRARDQGSLDGVLQAADAFSRLGDASVVRQALVVARDLAGGDPVAHARVDIAAEELGVRLASADGPEHSHGNGGCR